MVHKIPITTFGRILAIILLLCVNTGIQAEAGSAKKEAAAKKAPPPPPAFTFLTVIEKAKALAAAPYRTPQGMVPPVLLNATYDQWRDIRFQTDKSLWRAEKLPFEVQFFHPGLYYDRTVAMNIVDEGKVSRYPVTKSLFNYGKNTFADDIPDDVGAAGFRFHAPIKTRDYYDEFLVFLGASYLRAVARDHHYGLSARAIAVDTATSTGEEFPWFREFWLVKPRPKDTTVSLYALLDSPSITGAYSFRATPGVETVIDVQSVLFLRKNVQKLGIAPLTSMFLFGENSNRKPREDYRPEVHDSDGLLVHFESGEWLWRPLQNPRTLQVNTFNAPNIRGFGLLQRDTKFPDYEDLEARYENRPSVWIEPKGNWGPGKVELIQIPSTEEIHDNIVSFWVPDQQPPPGEPVRYDYTMRWLTPSIKTSPPGYVTATRIARGKDDKNWVFVLDWDGEAIRKLKEDTKIEGVVTVMSEGARLVQVQTYRNTVTGGWRLSFEITIDPETAIGKVLPDRRPPVELRAFLKNGPDFFTETWSYAFKP